MRRIILGAIWLIGFLAVLLSWGIMYSRAQGEGPSRIIVTVRRPNDCQLEVIFPEIDKRLPIGESSDSCLAIPLEWSGSFLYYLNEHYTNQVHHVSLERVNQGGDHHEVILPDTWRMPYQQFITPDARYLIEAPENPWVMFTTDLARKYKQPILSSWLSVTSNRIFSPDGKWLIISAVQGGDQDSGWRTFLVRTDGSETIELPLPEDFPLTPADIVLWSDSPEWLVGLHSYSWDGTHLVYQVYRIQTTGSDFDVLASSDIGPLFSGWVHQSGLVGLLSNHTFSTLNVDTGEILWQMEGVEEVLHQSSYLTGGAQLEKDRVYFKMTDGRLARCRLDGSDLMLYDTQRMTILRIWGWSSDGEWVWLSTEGSNPDHNDIVRVQRDTGKSQVVLDEVQLLYIGQSPDQKWGYYQMNYSQLYRVNLDEVGQPQRIVPGEQVDFVSVTPPYQAEWQPARTLTLGIGLMSLSTLLNIFFWRRRRNFLSRSTST